MVNPRASPARVAADVKRALGRMARPAGAFDASRYFRGAVDLGFHNVGTSAVRKMARTIYRAHLDDWSVDDAAAFADVLMADRYLEVKSVGIELLACYRRVLPARLLPAFKAWLARDDANNWATTDAICIYLIGPLIVAHPPLAARVGAWTRHRNMWVRRAAAVSLVPSARKGVALDVAYDVAGRLHADREDLIQKAVGWLLREAGKTDMSRLERYLRANGPSIPRTTVRYAIERMSEPARRRMLVDTKQTGTLG
jgi:3-methyladenine DNA glycosylase AlkD